MYKGGETTRKSRGVVPCVCVDRRSLVGGQKYMARGRCEDEQKKKGGPEMAKKREELMV